MTTKLSPQAFRVWDNQERRYLPDDEGFNISQSGHLVTCQSERKSCGCCNGEWCCDVKQDAERYTIERFTGRAQIFEGDVVMWDDLLHEVVFCDGGFALKMLNEDTNICCEIFGLADDELPDVLGTIHDDGLEEYAEAMSSDGAAPSGGIVRAIVEQVIDQRTAQIDIGPDGLLETGGNPIT